MKKRKTDNKKSKGSPGYSVKKTVLLALFAAVLVGITAFISLNFYQLMLITGDSMLPSYHNMQFVILDRHTKSYTYGDVIAFRCDSVKTPLVKRIAACPGDSIVIKNKALYVNGEISAVFPDARFDYAGLLEETLTLGDGEYFAVGDNIAQSKDCRYPEIGVIKSDSVSGVVAGNN